MSATARLSPLLLGGGLRRSSSVDPRYHGPDYLARLDRETLVYDAIWQAGRLHLVCPKFNDLWPLVQRAEWRLDGRPVPAGRIRRYRRHEVVELRAPARPDSYGVALGGWEAEAPVSPDGAEAFAGQDCALYISRDNPLDWLVDHARFHIHHHGLEGLLVMDNGSTGYGAAEIVAALAPLGLAVTVLEAPFPYGPVGHKPYRRREKFLQTALFNIARLRFMGRARGVLSCDVDELVIAPGSIFELARASRLGQVSIPGEWVWPEETDKRPTHADHVLRADPPRPAPSKWACVPGGPLARFSWDVHGPERLPSALVPRRGRFLHCRRITTDWKSEGRKDRPDTLVRDPEAAAALAPIAHFP